MALAAGGDLLSQVEALLDEHQSIEWRERAKGQVARFVEAAKRGVKPDDVQFDCTKCTASGHSHHFMCRQNKKQKDRDTQVKNKVLSALRKAAGEAGKASAVRARHSSPSNPRPS